MANHYHSKKRDAILECVRSTASHPTAEWVYQQLKPSQPDLSLGTVYRNIKNMVASGDVLCVGTVEGKERYDAHVEPHAHLVCRSCGTVVDMDITADMALQCHTIARENGVELDLSSLHFMGLCSKCKSETKS